jgi:hypothetical protein
MKRFIHNLNAFTAALMPQFLPKMASHIGEGTLCYTTQIFTYRTKNGKGYYYFRYVQVSNYWEVDIEETINYQGRSRDLNTIHQIGSHRSATGYKICVHSGKEPKSLEAAQSLSKAWAELTQTYIETGKTIDDQIANQGSGSFWDWLFG